MLEKAGYTMGSNGFFEKGGKTVAITIIAPSAYTDMSEVDSIAAQELKAAGIDATFQGISVNAWNADVADGDFSVTEHWSNGGISPYNMYDGWLDSSLASGSTATGDYERLNDPAINADLATLAGASTVAQQTAALVPIEKYVAANLPVIPVTTASEWFEYNSQNYTGWPTQDEPLRVRPAVGDEQRSRLRHRRSSNPAPASGVVSKGSAAQPKRARPR